MKKSDRKVFLQGFAYIAFGITLYAVIMHLGEVKATIDWMFLSLSPLWMAATFAVVLNVPMRGIETFMKRMKLHEKLPNGLFTAISILLTMVTGGIIIYLVVGFIVPQFVEAITRIVYMLQYNSQAFIELAAKVGIEESTVREAISQLLTWINQNVGMITNAAFSTVFKVVSSVTNLILALILCVYMLAGKKKITRQARYLLTACMPDRMARGLLKAGRLFATTFSTFFSRQCLEAVILGGILLLCMMIFGLPNAVSIACLTAVLALIPFVGAYLSCIVGVMMLLLIDPQKALIFAIVFLTAQQVEGNVIYPRVVGNSVGLPSYVTLSAVLVGGAFFGIAGMFFVIPVVSVIYALLREWVQYRLAQKANPEAQTQKIEG